MEPSVWIYPLDGAPARLDPGDAFMVHLRQASRGVYTAVSQIDGVERISAYSQVKSYPLFVGFESTLKQFQHLLSNTVVLTVQVLSNPLMKVQ